MPHNMHTTASFLSTLSLRRATRKLGFVSCGGFRFLSTLSLRRATSCGWCGVGMLNVFLSTLSLRRATKEVEKLSRVTVISIHALLAESDHRGRLLPKWGHRFLSTLSLRRATAKVHKTVGHFCAYETNFIRIASSC